MIIGFLGAGQMAQTLAPVWLRAGHRVLLANSRGPASLADLVATLGPAASAVTPPELAGADVVVLATRWDQLPKALAGVGPLTGKVVVDATNNFVDDKLVDIGPRGSSEVVAELVPGARLVKAFNHLLIRRLGTLHDHAEPLALYLAGDDPAAKAVVAGYRACFDERHSLPCLPQARVIRFIGQEGKRQLPLSPLRTQA